MKLFGCLPFVSLFLGRLMPSNMQRECQGRSALRYDMRLRIKLVSQPVSAHVLILGKKQVLAMNRLVGLVVKAVRLESGRFPGSNPACAGIFRGRVIPVTSKLALQWLPCQAPGVIGSALGLVGPVSVFCDWVR